MGFKIKQNARLEFEGDEYVDGETGDRLAVEVRLDFNIGQFYELQRALTPISEGADDDPLSEESQQRLETAVRTFGERMLVSWNLTDDEGNGIPETADGAAMVPVRLISDILGHWSDAVTEHMGVSADDPLPESSPNGEPSLAGSATTAA